MSILLLCYEQFRKDCIKEFRQDPLNHLTIASLAFGVYKANYLTPEGVILIDRKKSHSSSHIANRDNINIQTNSSFFGEKVLKPVNGKPPVFLDGYCSQTNTAYIFHGCYWHGCKKPNCHQKNVSTV